MRQYEVERIYLTDETGQPANFVDAIATIDAPSARDAARLFVEREGARLLGTICDAPGDQCTATAWREGRLYVITIWPAGQRPVPPVREEEGR
jgi:hypothetical protein